MDGWMRVGEEDGWMKGQVGNDGCMDKCIFELARISRCKDGLNKGTCLRVCFWSWTAWIRAPWKTGVQVPPPASEGLL